MTIVTMLYITSPGHIYFILYLEVYTYCLLFSTFTHFPPPPTFSPMGITNLFSVSLSFVGLFLRFHIIGVPWWLIWLRICLQCGRSGFNPWVGKIPWRRKWLPTLVFLPGELPWTEEPGGLQSTGSQRVRHNWVTNM